MASFLRLLLPDCAAMEQDGGRGMESGGRWRLAVGPVLRKPLPPLADGKSLPSSLHALIDTKIVEIGVSELPGSPQIFLATMID